jgi:hypothetical protein
VIKLALIPIEGSEKATREGEWVPIKISRENLAYVPKQTQHTSLLTRPRPHSYSWAIGPWNRVREHNHSRKHETVQARVTSETITTLPRTSISSNILWACSRNNYGSSTRTRKTQAFNPAAQEQTVDLGFEAKPLTNRRPWF